MWSWKGCHFSDAVDSSASNNCPSLVFLVFFIFHYVLGKEKCLSLLVLGDFGKTCFKICFKVTDEVLSSQWRLNHWG